MNGEKSALRAKPARLAAPDQDYQARLEATDKLLSAVIHLATKYRHMVKCALVALRTGADPGPVRASLEPWARTLREVKRLAREL